MCELSCRECEDARENLVSKILEPIFASCLRANTSRNWKYKMPHFHRDIKHFPFNLIFLLPEKPSMHRGRRISMLIFHLFLLPLWGLSLFCTLCMSPLARQSCCHLCWHHPENPFPRMLLPQLYPTAACGGHLQKQFYQVEGSQLGIYQNILSTTV